MSDKLTALAQIIENHFDKEVWHSQSPIHETDLKLALLATRIYSIRRRLKHIENVELELTELKAHMEQEFKIPLIEEELNAWLNKDAKRHKVVIDIYRQL